MELSGRIFPIVILSCLFVVTLIHLGLSIGIIVDFRKYGDIFRPQIGLSAFNLAITFFGLVTAVLGLAANAFGLKILGNIFFTKQNTFAIVLCFFLEVNKFESFDRLRHKFHTVSALE